MWNLELIEIHRRKLGLLLALFLTFFIYLVVAIFVFTSEYFRGKTEDAALYTKVERVKAIAKAYEILTTTNDIELDRILEWVLQDSYIYNDVKTLVNNIEYGASLKVIESDVIIAWEGRKYFKTHVTKGDIVYSIIVKSANITLLERYSRLMILLVILLPVLYSLLALVLCKFMSQVYWPLKETVINLESFASNINHEFKTSLSEIISTLELAKVTEEYKEANDYSAKSARRLDSMLDSLGMLIHFVNSDYRKERVDLHQTLSECLKDVERLIKNKGIQIIKKYDEKKTLYRYIDKSPLILSFENILKNAVKYSENWWEIEIFIEQNSFSIKDYGIGIEEKNLDKIFDRYFRESYAKSWSGIGLSIIKRITEIYKWEIDIQSEKNKYTKVTISF